MSIKKWSAQRSELKDIFDWLHEQLGGNECRKAKFLELAVEEIVVNNISYAYDNGGELQLFFERNGDQVIVEVRDWGKAFDPLTGKKQVDKTIPLEERQEGGFGIMIATHTVDHIEYRRENTSNVVKLSQSITS